ncbi:thioredoxin [Apibacter muscae]|uniref:thioredoxin domain-containing protein n=1 Tax=Apibacter muscae TaxID=2509004 RepID=UPI0011AC49C4|nr:thioredoxin domain-containing protein [Apibacter muscae]TWP28085.1 thioredoxin [Apibacter muscae]
MQKLFLSLTLIIGGILSSQTNHVLNSEEFSKKFTEEGVVILDVRTPEEYNTGHLENAIDIDYRNPSFKEKIQKLDKNKTYMVYCRTGVRSAAAIDSLKSLGFKNLYDLQGGITEWKKQNRPVVGEMPDKISYDEFNKLLKSDDIVLVDFYAPWCGPCVQMTPMFERLSDKYKNKLTLVKINADENKNLSKPYIEKGFPILIAYKNGKIQWEQIGLLDEDSLTKLIEDLIN